MFCSPKINVAKAKNGWFQSDSNRGTIDVLGSVNQKNAPMLVNIDITMRSTVMERKYYH